MEYDDFFDDLDENIIDNDMNIAFDAKCVRQKSNWSKRSKIYRFDEINFDPKMLLKDIPEKSPKLKALLKKINELDKNDLKKHGKLFKHFIFSDLKSSSYGAKLIASALIASGMKIGYNAEINPKYVDSEEDEEEESDSDSDDYDSVEQKGGENTPEKKNKNNEKRYNKIELLSNDVLERTKNKNFYLLSSVSVYDQPISTVLKKSILKSFNSRPDNIHGELARIIVMDSGFKEGIDLFDIKYVHIFEPSTVPADQKQVIGRGTRTCGQRGLDFHPQQGWPLHVFVYDLEIPDELKNSFMGTKTAIELYLKAMNLDIRLLNFASDLEKTTVVGSVDYDLNKNIHSFSIPIISIDEKREGFELNEHLHGSKEAVYNGGGPKQRLSIREGEPFVVPEPKRLGYNEMRDYIKDQFSEFTWESVKMENLCAEKQSGGSGEIIKMTPTQDFIRHYFTPTNPVKGMLLHHSVGCGKTCSAIAAATTSFEKQGYTILWVTRTTLKSDIWKNMFDQVCSESIRNQITNSGLQIPDEQNKRMRLLSKAWSIRPMSYKQFSNLVSKQNSLYNALVKINGKEDPLRKTLLIIDEAHKLYGGGDLSSIEKPDMNALHQALMYSYQYSGIFSVKLLLMTATPITTDPMELIKLINLCKPPDEQMPSDFDSFSKSYLDDDGKFTDRGRAQYLDDISGYVSYLNREKDARQFAQPIIEHIHVPISDDIDMAKRFDKKIVRDIMESDLPELKNKLKEESKLMRGELGDLDINKFKFLKDEICGDLEGSSLKTCERVVNQNIKLMVKEAKVEADKIRGKIKELRELIKDKNETKKVALADITGNIEEYEDDYEQYKGTLLYQLKNKCGKKVSNLAKLSDIINQHPHIINLDEKIKDYNNRITDLSKEVKQLSENYKKRKEYLKNMLKEDLNELERSSIKTAIKCNHKEYSNLIKLKQNNVTLTKRDINKKIKGIQKTRKMHIGNIQKTIKKKIIEDERKKRALDTEERKIRKTLRKQQGYQEEIKHELLNTLVKKYRSKIMDNLVDIDEESHAKEVDKNEKIRFKELEKQRKLANKKREAEEKKANREKEKQTKKAEKANARKTKKTKG